MRGRRNANQWLLQLAATKLPTSKYHRLIKDKNQSKILEEMLLLAEDILTEERIWQRWVGTSRR